MGVIKKILYRGNILGKPRHRNLFLDMEENIHIHYRDLRIELSRAEFEDFAKIFKRQSAELQAIIEEKKYQDGKFANANQDDVRIWTESRLPSDIKYHPTRLSLEECGDGYHFHYRNIKILIDKPEFRELASLFRSMDLDAPYATSYDEVLALLEANDVDFTLGADNLPGEILALDVAQYHMPKVRDIFKYIEFASHDAEGGEKHYIGPRLKVIARPNRLRDTHDYRHMRGLNSVTRVVDYLTRAGAAGVPAEELNHIKVQALDLYFSLLDGKARDVDTDPQNWLYSPGNRRLIFPYKAVAETPGRTVAEQTYRAWANFLNQHKLGFVKPAKKALPADEQKALRAKVDETIRREVASFAAVSRIYIMGSAVRGDMGHYETPFIHGKLAKLGSDVDILVELDPKLEGEVPGSWHLHIPESSNHCTIYHVGDVELLGGIKEWQSRFPNVKFQQHLIDAYVHFPSKGFVAEKDAFLKKFNAQVFYDRARDGIVYHSDVETRIAAKLAESHGIQGAAVEPMKVSTENAVFAVHGNGKSSVLKLFKVSGNYRSVRVPEHVEYEEKLVNQLRKRGVPTAEILPAKKGADTKIEGFPALLFERIPGAQIKKPDYPMERIVPALAQIHATQMEKALTLSKNFLFDDACMIWLPTFEDYWKNKKHIPEIAEAFANLAPIAQPLFPGETRAALFARSPLVHCHGDVTPKNVFAGESGVPRFFDFNNAFYGPRMADIVDGALEFSLAEKYIHLADFGRFDKFIEYYAAASPLTGDERADLRVWTDLIGIIKFTKEVRVLLERPKENLRRKRALAVAGYLSSLPRGA